MPTRAAPSPLVSHIQLLHQLSRLPLYSRARGTRLVSVCVVELAGWLLSGATLVLIPKCPACLAAYLALATGIGISFSTAAYLRLLLLFICLGSMVYLVVRRVKRRRGFLVPS